MRLNGKLGVLRERDFRRFYAGYVTSLLGTAMSPIAIAWAVLQAGGSATELGYVFTANVVPQVALMALAGAVADRFGRRRVMLTADVVRACGRAALAVVMITGHPSLTWFLVFAVAGGSGDAFFAPALSALTAEIAPRDQLGNANAMYGLASSAALIVGPVLSGLVTGLAGPAAVVALDAASYAASAVALGSLAPRESGRHGRRRSLLRDMAEGWADFRGRTWLWTVSVQFAFFNLITWAPWMLLGPVAGREYFGGARVWGVIMAIQGAGAVLGGVLCLGRRPRRPMVIATLGSFCYALPDIPMALHASAPWVAPAAFMCGMGSVLFGTFYGTTQQQRVPAGRLARVSALITFPAYGIGVIGYAVDGPLASALGTSAVFGVGAIYGILSSAVVLCTPAIRAIRWPDDAPAARPSESERRSEPGPPIKTWS